MVSMSRGFPLPCLIGRGKLCRAVAIAGDWAIHWTGAERYRWLGGDRWWWSCGPVVALWWPGLVVPVRWFAGISHWEMALGDGVDMAGTSDLAGNRPGTRWGLSCVDYVLTGDVTVGVGPSSALHQIGLLSSFW
jgi:hypothetical protein